MSIVNECEIMSQEQERNKFSIIVVKSNVRHSVGSFTHRLYITQKCFYLQCIGSAAIKDRLHVTVM